jgi:nephrocystin-3
MLSTGTTLLVTSIEAFNAKSATQIKKALAAAIPIVDEQFVNDAIQSSKLDWTRALFAPESLLAQMRNIESSSISLSMYTGGTSQVRSIDVFISSTFVDMKRERESLVVKVLPALRQRCQDVNVFVNFVDLRWGITSEQSESGQVLRTCLTEIDRCRPYFVALLGERYGWAQHS